MKDTFCPTLGCCSSFQKNAAGIISYWPRGICIRVQRADFALFILSCEVSRFQTPGSQQGITLCAGGVLLEPTANVPFLAHPRYSKQHMQTTRLPSCSHAVLQPLAAGVLTSQDSHTTSSIPRSRVLTFLPQGTPHFCPGVEKPRRSCRGSNQQGQRKVATGILTSCTGRQREHSSPLAPYLSYHQPEQLWPSISSHSLLLMWTLSSGGVMSPVCSQHPTLWPMALVFSHSHCLNDSNYP